MTSLQGFTDGSYDYKHMYNIKDRRGCLPQPTLPRDSILGYLYSHDHQPVADMIRKALLHQNYQSPRDGYTFFVPLHLTKCDVATMSVNDARRMTLLHTLDRPLSDAFIRGSPYVKLTTRLDGSFLYIHNKGTPRPIVNGRAEIVGSQRVGTSMLFFINDLMES